MSIFGVMSGPGNSGDESESNIPYEAERIKVPCYIHCAFNRWLVLCEFHEANNAGDARAIESQMRVSVWGCA